MMAKPDCLGDGDGAAEAACTMPAGKTKRLLTAIAMDLMLFMSGINAVSNGQFVIVRARDAAVNLKPWADTAFRHTESAGCFDFALAQIPFKSSLHSLHFVECCTNIIFAEFIAKLHVYTLTLNDR